MTLLKPALIPAIEYPQGGIDRPVAFPREPEPNKNICPTLRPSRGDQIPEDKDPAIAQIETEIGTTIVTAIETVTVTKTAAAVVVAEAAVNNLMTAVPAVAAPIANRNRFR